MNIESLLIGKNNFIFDMDGTLVNLEELNRTSYQNTIDDFFNFELSDDAYQRFFAGTRTKEAFIGFLQDNGVNESEYKVVELIKHFRSQKRKALLDDFNNNVFIIDGAYKFLEKLSENNKRLVLATSSVAEFTNIILSNLKIKKFFRAVLTAEDVHNSKPDPEIYNLALEKIDAEVEKSVIFEDSRNGIKAAKAAKVFCVGVRTRGFNDDWVGNADYVIDDYEGFI
jgi:HAD superfamily hydrolase (TIGR01509 family)